jgi:hypothetical protein
MNWKCLVFRAGAITCFMILGIATLNSEKIRGLLLAGVIATIYLAAALWEAADTDWSEEDEEFDGQ